MVQNMDLQSGNECTTMPMKCCKKLVSKSMVDTTPSLKDGTLRTSSAILCIQYDELALEDHSYVATKDERIGDRKGCALKLNEEGAQGPMNQRPDFADAKENSEDCMMNM